MKKLITLTTALLALMIGAAAINAQPAGKLRGNRVFRTKAASGMNAGYLKNKGFYYGHYNRRGVYIYKTTRIVFKRRGKFKNTYLHKIFPNGRHKVKLIKSVKIRHVYPVKVRYKSKIVYLGRHRYRVTYKITRFSNGRVTRVIYKRKPLWKSWYWRNQ